jgi:hypothetical protein
MTFIKRKMSDDDLQEARKTWEMSKQLGLYAKLEDKVLQNLSKLRRNTRKRITPKRYK